MLKSFIQTLDFKCKQEIGCDTTLIKDLPKKVEMISIGPDALVRWATKVMARRNIGALALVQDGVLIGIVSERDIVRRCVAEDKRAGQTRIREIMTPNPITLGRDQSVLTALAVMMENNVRHLPIECEAGKFCQMLSLKDVIAALRKTMEKQILNFLLAMAEDDLDNVIPMHR